MPPHCVLGRCRLPAANARSASTLDADHALLCTAVQEAGEAVLRRYRGKPVRMWTKGDSSPVSEADLEANEILQGRLVSGNRQDYGWLSEESADDPTRLAADRVWIIDPIDGTRAFLEGKPEFTVCGALIEDGQAILSAVYNPVTDEFFEAAQGKGARCNGTPLTTSGQCDLPDCKILGWHGMFDRPGWPEPWPAMQIGYRNSTAYRMTLVAKGVFDAALALVRKPDWDVAPGALILSEAGASVSDHLGAPFRFNQPEPIQRGLVCAATPLYPAILSKLKHLPSDLRALKRF